MDGRNRVALATLSVAQLMLVLDTTIVNVALPSIQYSLRLPGSALEWVVTGYSVPFGGLLLLGGRAGDIAGRRLMFTGGLALFTAASLLGGLAPAAWWLITCRAVQGIGAACAYPASLSLITSAFPDGPVRQRAVGTLTAVGAAGGAIGLLAGGAITTYLSWRWVLFVNVPVGAALIAAALRSLPETPRSRDRIDVAGALTITAGLTLAVYALTRGSAGQDGRSHWQDPAVAGSLAAAAVLVLAFVLVERRSPHPLVPLRIFADSTRSGTYVAMMALNGAMSGIFFFLTIFLQRVWGYSPLQTSIVYAPLSGLLMAGAWAGGRLVGRAGVRNLAVGGLIAATAGMAWLSRIGSSGGYATGMLVPTVLTYGGIGLTTVPMTLAALARVPAKQAGLASGLFNAARQIGWALGLAAVGTVTWAEVAAAARGAAHGQSGPPGLPSGIPPQALTMGIGLGILVAAGLAGTALVIALLTSPRRASAARAPAAEPVAASVADSDSSPSAGPG